MSLANAEAAQPPSRLLLLTEGRALHGLATFAAALPLLRLVVVNTASAAGLIAPAIGVALQFISVCSVIAGFSKSRVLSDGISA